MHKSSSYTAPSITFNEDDDGWLDAKPTLHDVIETLSGDVQILHRAHRCAQRDAIVGIVFSFPFAAIGSQSCVNLTSRLDVLNAINAELEGEASDSISKARLVAVLKSVGTERISRIHVHAGDTPSVAIAQKKVSASFESLRKLEQDLQRQPPKSKPKGRRRAASNATLVHNRGGTAIRASAKSAELPNSSKSPSRPLAQKQRGPVRSLTVSHSSTDDATTPVRSNRAKPRPKSVQYSGSTSAASGASSGRSPPKKKLTVVHKQGWLTKQGALIKNWKRRFFSTSTNETGDKVLKYYKEEGDVMPLGVIPLSGARVQLVDGCLFSIICTDRTFLIRGETTQQIGDWIYVLKELMKQ